MSAAPVRQSQITRAVKAVQAAGVPVGRVEIAPDGTVKVYSGAGEMIDDDDAALNDWIKRDARKD